MYRINVILSNAQSVSVEDKEIERSLKDWYLKQVLNYSEQCMDLVKILLILSVAGITAVSYIASQITQDLPRFWELAPQVAFGLCILFSSATYFPIGLRVSASVDIQSTLRSVVLKDYAMVATSVFCFCVGIGLTVVLSNA